MTDGITEMYDEERLKAQILHEEQGEDFGMAEDPSEVYINIEQAEEPMSTRMMLAAAREEHIRSVERLLEYLKSTR